ncbi:phenylalanyl-tRNA synthetase alpha chain [Methanococcus voltae]|uniref:phenylalanine--tRNA ligase subunit alpha n=1 Tax=Methanococcus voltae TaxID=2188 RepID=UPI001AE4DFB9|nr:phenylalanine--tRNA ligase subunit alpha [Methanococcus voltae]MBP2143045.1 phenylalanyl-tRNA synthetase alpha chain [Methanococcus voltae]
MIIDVELHNDEKRILQIFQKFGKNTLDFEEISQEIEKEKIMRAGLWLTGHKLAEVLEESKKLIKLSKEGIEAKEKQLPERRLSKYILDNKFESIAIKDLSKVETLEKGEINPLLGNLKKKNLVAIDKGNIVFKNLDYEDEEEILISKIANLEDGIEISKLSKEDKKTVDSLKKRGLIEVKEIKNRELKLTPEGIEYIKNPIEIKEEITQLTKDDILSGKWKECDIRAYDATIPTEKVYPAKPHPMAKIIDDVKDILVSIGFKEVKTSAVQTELWNFDSLFEPQDHPARDMQDTFFLKYPNIGLVDEELLQKLKLIHEKGIVGDEQISKGWGYIFSEEVSKKVVLRTHTTVSSIKYLASLSEEEKEKAQKVFCIDRVFRNEAIDYKHLPEFYQCEGIVMDDNVNFDNLVGLLSEFLNKLGFEKVRIRPAYFPFTEPSLEAEVYVEGKGWMELLGAGIFRPEVLEPFGIKKPVLAWGIGLSRLIMMILELQDIRELHKNDLDWIRNSRVKTVK